MGVPAGTPQALNEDMSMTAAHHTAIPADVRRAGRNLIGDAFARSVRRNPEVIEAYIGEEE